jgi:hypothetical protein
MGGLEFSAGQERRINGALPVSRPNFVLRHHDGIDVLMAAPRTPPAKLDQRHVTATGIYQGLEIGVTPVAARPTRQAHPNVRGGQSGPRCW